MEFCKESLNCMTCDGIKSFGDAIIEDENGVYHYKDPIVDLTKEELEFNDKKIIGPFYTRRSCLEDILSRIFLAMQELLRSSPPCSMDLSDEDLKS